MAETPEERTLEEARSRLIGDKTPTHFIPNVVVCVNAARAAERARLSALVPPMVMTVEQDAVMRDDSRHTPGKEVMAAEIDALRAALAVARDGDECPFCHHPIQDHYDADACLVEGCGCLRYVDNKTVKEQGDMLVALRAKYAALVEAARVVDRVWGARGESIKAVDLRGPLNVMRAALGDVGAR